ncbi:MAG: ChbG/HpnK family deacetylase [Acidobacteria bacterium]|nr:MAG: ChbG/HpnK family deacetylase [Acidobacteriota bacterium]
MSPAFFSYLYTRHLMGRAFNLLCRTFVLPGVRDTQAGLKGIDLRFVRPLLGRMVLDGFSFDVELLRAIRDAGGAIEEVPVVFRYDSEPSTVRFIADSLRMARDLARVRWCSLRGTWRRASSPRVETVADDFGLSADVNEGIRELLERGAVTGTSILACADGSSEAIAWAASHPQFDYGAHLSLTEGRPVLDPGRVPSLVGPDGRFVPLGRFFCRWLAGRICIDEVRAEWSAQIDRLREAGVPLRRLDSHQHVHLLAPLFRGVASPLARTHGLRVRTMSGVGRPRLVPPDLRGVILRALSWWSRRACPAGVVLSAGTGTTLLGCPELREVRRLVAQAPGPETVELVVHPGRPSSGRLAVGSRWDATRGREFDLLLQPEVRALLGTFAGAAEHAPEAAPPVTVEARRRELAVGIQ